MQEDDIPHIADYWLCSDKSFLWGMGVDLSKLPARKDLSDMLLNQLALPDEHKASLAMILEIDGEPAGHCNVNEIQYGIQAKMHLHIWNADKRRSGMGRFMVESSLPVFFRRLKLQRVISEPYAMNPAPAKTLKKAGFTFIKRYTTIPGSLNFEQEVNRYQLTLPEFERLRSKPEDKT